MASSFDFPPERPIEFVGNFRPAESYIVQFVIAHDRELTANAGALAPNLHHGQHSAADGKC
jgi:hypothetical protein